MSAIKIAENIFWVGVVDWDIRNFHGHTYTTKRGTTYNSYLIIDDKITLIDGVYTPFVNEWIEKIRQIIPPEKIDYIITNHAETDHSGTLPQIMKLAHKAKMFATAKCKQGLEKHYYGNWDFCTVKSGDRLKLGKRTLSFIEAPMLHWPDSMFSYLKEDKILFPNDAFGQHLATKERFDDEVDKGMLMDEAAKYYGNILWPLSNLVLKKLEEVQKAKIPIKMIAPSHGIIWRADPSKIVNKYVSWAKNQTGPKIVIIYETMWGATAKMAEKIAQGITDTGINVKLFDVSKDSKTEIIKEMLDAKGYLIGSSTHDTDMLPNIAGFLHFLKGLKPKNRLASVFGSFGWAGGAVRSIENVLQETGIDIIQPSFSVEYVPSEDELKQCYEFGKNFSKKIS